MPDSRLIRTRNMREVSVSPRYQVVIPKEIRKQMAIRPGARMAMIPYRGHIAMVPLRDIRSLRGTYPELSSRGTREHRDRV